MKNNEEKIITEEKVTFKEKMKNWRTNFNEKHPKLKGTLLKLGLGITAVAGGAAIGYTIGHRNGTAIADLAEDAAEGAADVMEDAAGDLIESVSESISDAI